MNDFAGINNSYRLTFGLNHPCPRACYATVMPSSSKVGIQALFVADLKRVTQRLHVQSLSYWAPANIGPYSQSFTVSLSPSTDWQSLIVSGQIGMIPSSLALTSAEEECELALAHANSVIAASIPAFASGPSPLTCDAVQVITSVNEVIESLVTNSSNTCTLMSAICLTTDMTNASHYSNIYLEEQESFYAPAVILQVTQLPKNATIEWLTQTFVPNPVNCDQDIGEEEQEDDNEGEVEMKVVRLCRMSDDNCKALMMHSFQIRRGCNRKQWEPVSTLILSKGRSMGNVIEEFELSNCWQATIYNTVGVSDEECAVLGAEIVAAQVPVLSIADVEGKRTDWTHALMMSH
jgi:enamine deaminase RidA (YjgF/YER057c/UK114 family)